jgi:hypothetical protein
MHHDSPRLPTARLQPRRLLSSPAAVGCTQYRAGLEFIDVPNADAISQFASPRNRPEIAGDSWNTGRRLKTVSGCKDLSLPVATGVFDVIVSGDMLAKTATSPALTVVS